MLELFSCRLRHHEKVGQYVLTGSRAGLPRSPKCVSEPIVEEDVAHAIQYWLCTYGMQLGLTAGMPPTAQKQVEKLAAEQAKRLHLRWGDEGFNALLHEADEVLSRFAAKLRASAKTGPTPRF